VLLSPGKVFGLQANYVIAEVEFHEGEDPVDIEEEREQAEAQKEKEVMECYFCHPQFNFIFKMSNKKITTTTTKSCQLSIPYSCKKRLHASSIVVPYHSVKTHAYYPYILFYKSPNTVHTIIDF